MTPDDLVARVARLYKDKWCVVDHQLARAVIAVVLEEAAKVAEAFPARTHGSLASAPYAAAEQAGDEIAAAIRAMIGKES